jgi:hypothetical protein
VIDASDMALRLEALLPIGVRPRQMRVRSLLLAMMLTQADGRPAHLTRVHGCLLELEEDARGRLGVVASWRTGAHTLTYRQVEYTFSRLVVALSKERPDGSPSELLSEVVDALLEASVPDLWKASTGSYAIDWSDLESFSCPPSAKGGPCADMEASWGHRRGKGPGQKDELFYGYYFQLATMVNDEGGPQTPELVRRLLVTSCHLDPPPAFVRVLGSMAAAGVTLGDLLADSGYAHRSATHWALPLRAMGASLVQDLHPHDGGMQGTFEGAICFNGNLYCPATPKGLFDIGPLNRQASEKETAEHDKRTAELARYEPAVSVVHGWPGAGWQDQCCRLVPGVTREPTDLRGVSCPGSVRRGLDADTDPGPLRWLDQKHVHR